MKHLATAALIAPLLCGFTATAAGAEDAPAATTSAVTSSPGRTANASALQPYVQPSIVHIGVEWTGYLWDDIEGRYLSDEPLTLSSSCTGFVVNPNGYIATAGHCVDPAEMRDVFTAAGLELAQADGFYPDSTLVEAIEVEAFYVDSVAPIAETVRSADGRGVPERTVTVTWEASASGIETVESMQARVLDVLPFDEGDGALLKVDERGLNAVELAPEGDVSVGTEVVAIGFPGSVDNANDGDLTPSFKTGSVSQSTTRENGLYRVYEVDAAMSQGMSGGPTVDSAGRVLGINSYGVDTQAFNFIRPSSVLRELLAKQGVNNELDETTTQYRGGLDAYFAGDKAAAVTALEAVTQKQPSNEIARDYLGKARALPDAPEQQSAPALVANAGSNSAGIDFWILAVAGGAVALALASGAVVLRCRRTAAAPIPSYVPAAGSLTFGPGAASPAPAGGEWADGGVLLTDPPLTSTRPFCTSCGTPAFGARYCGACGTAL